MRPNRKVSGRPVVFKKNAVVRLVA